MKTSKDEGRVIGRVVPAIATILFSAGVSAQIEEILVTAEFREKSTMDTALSITAVDKALMDKLRMEDTRDIAAQVPNVHIENSPMGMSSPRISMRGITNADYGPTSASPVTVYSDGIVINSTTTQGFAMFDLERMEVLRGPQGTLYGRNATTGSINFISARPTAEFEGYGRFTVGRYGQQRFESAISGPLSEKVNGRLAILKASVDGWVENIASGRKSPHQDDLSVRGMLDIDLTDDISVFLKAQYSESDGRGGVHHNLLPFNTLSRTPNPGGGNNFRKVNLDLLSPSVEVEAVDLAFQVDWDLGNMVLTSLTGYQENDRWYINDADSTDWPLIHENWFHEQDQFSQEFRLASTTNSSLSWIAGLYYMKDTLDNAGTRFDVSALLQLATGAPESAGFGSAWEPEQEITTYAAFVQLDYEFSDQWSAGFGLRYTEDETDIDYFGATCRTFVREDERSFTDYSNTTGLCGPAGSLADSNSWDAVTGGLSVQYRPNSGTLLYGNISKGFKGGAYNLNTADVTEVDSVDPESLLSYELGVKWESEARDVVLSAAAFFYDYEDFHQFAITDIINEAGIPEVATRLTNVPSAEVIGAEIELMYAPTSRSLINLGFSWADTEYKDFLQADGTDFTGNEFAHAPRFQFNGLAQYEFPLGRGDWTITPQLDWYWRDRYFEDNANTTWYEVEGVNYRMNVEADWDVNFRVTLESVDIGLAITAFIEDIGEDDGDIQGGSGISGVTNFGTFWRWVESPETYGITISYKF